MFDGIVSSVVGGLGQLIGGQQANQKNWDIAQANNDWSAQQFATRYQTTVKDLQSAGLNPMLAYGQGGGSPPTAAPVPPRINTIGNATEAAIIARQSAADIALKGEQTIATTAQAEVSRTQALTNIANTAKLNQDEKTSAAVEEVNRKQLDAIAAEIEYKKAATRTTTALTGKTVAETKNVQANEAPSGDPYWYRDIKKFYHSAKDAWADKIAPSNKYLKGK